MAIEMLKEVQVRKALPEPGKRSRKLNDGGGLWLYVTHTKPTTKNPDGVISKSFVFRYTLGESKGQDLAIGPYPRITLSRARSIAEEFRDQVAQGICPKQHKRDQADQHQQSRNLERTFSEVAAEFIEAKQSEWTNPKHAQQVRNTLKTYAEVVMGKKPISVIRVEDVEAALRPIWNNKTETAKRVRNRIEQVIDFAIVKGYRPKEAMNPAIWRGNLQHILTSPAKLQKENHFDALPYDEQPKFTAELVAKLDRSRVLAAAPLLLVILTASRTGAIIDLRVKDANNQISIIPGASWSEIDFDKATWTIPAERMKAGIEHVIPLSTQAMALLARQRQRVGSRSKLIFPGQVDGRSISSAAMDNFLQGASGMNYPDITVHGFRSSFRDWSGEMTDFQREVIEAALAHQLKDKAERAYFRGNLLDKRRGLMQAWADYCFSAISENGGKF